MRLARTETTLTLIVAALVAGVYFWTGGLQGGAPFSRKADSYYALQTEGFLSGHLYAAIEPNPALLALRDPYDPVANAPYQVHDMSLWHGRYYLYFGVAPILLVYLPCRVLTGYYPSEPLVVAFFCTLGFGFGSWLLLKLRRACFPQVGTVPYAVVLLTFGLAGPVLLLNQWVQFYQVPISCAFALIMAGCWALAWVLIDGCRPGLWLTVAGLCFGLCMAARPNYVLAMTGLGLPALWCLRRADPAGRRLRRGLGFLAAAFGPVTAVGIGLLIYNWMRFGNPFEFGMRYQLAGQSFLHVTSFSWRYLLPHAGDYLWGKAWWVPWFPFFSPLPGGPFGALRYLPMTWLVPLAFWPDRSLAKTARGGLRGLACVILWVGMANCAMLSVFFAGPVPRYMVDFTPAWLLVGCVGGLALIQLAKRRRLAVAAVMAGAVASLGLTFCVYVANLPPGRQPVSLERAANVWAARLGRIAGWRYGAVRMRLELPDDSPGAVEPLLQTGYVDGRLDWLQLRFLSGHRGQMVFFHSGLGDIVGQPFALPADRRMTVEVSCGSLLPPATFPLFRGWHAPAIAALQRRLAVEVDGRVVLSAALQCYSSRPWDLRVGRLGLGGGVPEPRFAGRILQVERLPVVRGPAVPASLISVRAPLRLRVQFPADGGGFEPLLATGDGRAGDLLYLVYGPRHTVRFAFFHPGAPPLRSKPVRYDPASAYDLTVWLGTWAGSEAPANQTDALALSRRLVVLMDGRTILNAEQVFSPAQGKPAILGSNPNGVPLASAAFSGLIQAEREVGFDVLPPFLTAGGYGAVSMTVMLPRADTGLSDPLVVAGRPTKGDFVYIKYLDQRHVVFGFDHWGWGGPVSPPIAVDYNRSQQIEISMDALYPPDSAEARRHRVVVRLNGRVVFDAPAECYPTTAREICVARNLIGGSTCRARFFGRILLLKRLPGSEQKPAAR